MECCICFESVSNLCLAPCQHGVCSKCRSAMISRDWKTCPLCRAYWPLPIKKILSNVEKALETEWLMGDPYCGIKIRWRIKRHSKRRRKMMGYGL